MTYTTWETIQNVMLTKNVVKWKVHGDDEELLQFHDPLKSELPRDSANTLKSFLDTLEGDNHVRVTLISPQHKGQRGGNTQATVFKYNYRLGNSRGRGRNNGGGNFGGDNLGIILQMMRENNQLSMQLALQEKERQIEKLQSKSKEGMSSLERVALKIGQGIYSEMRRKGALTEAEAIGDDDEQEQPQRPKTPAKKAQAVKKEKREPVTKKTFATRSGAAIKRLAAVGGLEVAEALEQIADMAEQDPEKLVNLLTELDSGE